jgi:alkylation response protein AidB-like acyl-CoA dehydrogenase
VRDRIAALAAEIEAARLLAVETARLIDEGKVPVHQAAMSKVQSSELMEHLAETAFDLLGSGAGLKGGVRSALIDGAFEFCIRDSLLYAIGGAMKSAHAYRSALARRACRSGALCLPVKPGPQSPRAPSFRDASAENRGPSMVPSAPPCC